MTHPSKSYKIQLFYRMLYTCSYDVLNANKSPLLKAFLQKELGVSHAKKLDCFLFHELMEQMIFDFKNQVEQTSYIDVSVDIRSNDRYIILRSLAQAKNITQELVLANFRIHKNTVKEVYRLNSSTLGEVIELSIMLFIVSCDEKTFKLIYFAFENFDI